MTSIVTDNGKKIIMNRAYKSTPDYTVPSKIKVGTDQDTPTVSDTDLTVPIPISNGTVNDDGSNTLTGSSGGDNSTDNTTTFKPGAGLSDATAQNLIANGTATTKIWTIADLASAGTDVVGTKPFGMWLYIVDATALAKIVSVEVKIGEDSSNYYSKTILLANLSVGWNWITSNTTNVEDLTETGTVTGDLDTFIIEIVTNLATDTFIAGDIIYDLLRQWESTDLEKVFSSGYPTINETTHITEIRYIITATEANGFLIESGGVFNTDSPDLMTDVDSFTGKSKSDTDEFVFVLKNQLT